MNETKWTPKTMVIEGGKLYLGETSAIYPSFGRIRVATMPKQPVGVGARQLGGQAQPKLLVFKPFIHNTSAAPIEMATVPTRCLDALGA